MNDGSSVVVDASVAVKWALIEEAGADRATVLLRAYLDRRITLLAPAFIRYEFGNALEIAKRKGRITTHSVASALESFMQLRIHADRDDDVLLQRALAIAGAVGTSVYDATYVAYAERLGLNLVSADGRLRRLLAAFPINVSSLDEVASLL